MTDIRRAQRVWSAYGFVLVLALAASSWAHGWWRVLPAVLVVVLVFGLSPWLSRRYRDR